MRTLAQKIDTRVEAVYFTRDSLVVNLMDGRTISVPLVWYPTLLNALPRQRSNWQVCGGGYGIHWPELDEDLSVEELLRGAPAPTLTIKKSVAKPPSKRRKSTRPQVRKRSFKQTID